MIKLLHGIYRFLPVQLLLLHFRKYQLLLLFWVILVATVTGNFAEHFGASSLFLAPEYLGEINFLSMFLLGSAMAIFVMAWNITTFIIHSHRIPFLGATRQAFLKYCINNSIIPLGFLVFYSIISIRFQYFNEHANAMHILLLHLGFYFGFIVFLLLSFAAQLFLGLARKANSESMQAWAGQMAIEGFNYALRLDPENDTIKVNLAECYIGTGETMQGVMMLRDVTEKNPENVPANLILGQQGIVSGQFDKAIERFQKVLRAEPENLEALLGMAEAYKNKGDKQKAIQLLEQAKQLMNNPEFSKDVDDYIKTFR